MSPASRTSNDSSSHPTPSLFSCSFPFCFLVHIVFHLLFRSFPCPSCFAMRQSTILHGISHSPTAVHRQIQLERTQGKKGKREVTRQEQRRTTTCRVKKGGHETRSCESHKRTLTKTLDRFFPIQSSILCRHALLCHPLAGSVWPAVLLFLRRCSSGPSCSSRW